MLRQIVKTMRQPRYVAVLILTMLACELGLLLLKASKKPLWFDELLTFYVSQLQPLSRVWGALRAGVDGMPAGYYIVVRFANALPVDHHTTVRLPSIVGYLLSLVGVYWFARKRLGVVAGLTAILILVLSPFRDYAVEARSYSLLVGFLATSAVLWQNIGQRRYVAPLFAGSLTLAVACHYYGVIAISIFCAAELASTVVLHRVRSSVWIGCILASSPFFIGLPVLLHYRDVAGTNFWAVPSWPDVLLTYGDYTGLSPTINLALISFLALTIVATISAQLYQRARRTREVGFSVPEIILIGSFLFYPVFLVTVTIVMPRAGYTGRYGWPAILGLVLGSVYLVRISWSERASHCLLGALFLTFLIRDVENLRALTKLEANNGEQQWAQLAAASRAYPSLPVVIGSPLKYLEAAEYAPEELRGQIIFVETSTPEQIKSVPQQIGSPQEFLPFRAIGIQSFRQQRFLLYSGGFLDYVTQYLIDNRYHLEILSKEAKASIFAVTP